MIIFGLFWQGKNHEESDHTGAAGFLGDNLSTGTMLNLIPTLGHPAFTFLPLDVASIQIGDHAEMADAEEIYHLASPASPKIYHAAPFNTVSVYGWDEEYVGAGKEEQASRA
jgi:hypothetical protein